MSDSCTLGNEAAGATKSIRQGVGSLERRRAQDAEQGEEPRVHLSGHACPAARFTPAIAEEGRHVVAERVAEVARVESEQHA